MRLRWAFSAVVVAAAQGCAGGADPAVGPLSTGVGSASQSTTTTLETSDDGEVDDDATTLASDDDAPLESSEGNGGSSSEGGESSTSMPPDPTDPAESSSDDGSVPPSDCPNQDTCDGAAIVGEISGDEDSDPIGTAGTESTWLTFQVTEDNDSVAGEAVSFTVTLTSPASVDFDLYVYRGAAGGPTGCNGVMDSSTSAAATDVVHMSWGEAGVANGVDDRAWVAVEIVPKGDMCDDGSQWTLEIVGDN